MQLIFIFKKKLHSLHLHIFLKVRVLILMKKISINWFTNVTWFTIITNVFMLTNILLLFTLIYSYLLLVISKLNCGLKKYKKNLWFCILKTELYQPSYQPTPAQWHSGVEVLAFQVNYLISTEIDHWSETIVYYCYIHCNLYEILLILLFVLEC